ncbi:putative serine/threonine protein phosphatase [Cardiosporidium cionae]|uniref:Serine/threonine-protein phosphatase n=1 Tax=Cardiosporidium cionae TaxID=476202 RepID=A0ABQ7J6Y6_9APIC|nr:putative serine/threonine protein phosphatase [Cardiosporidium cionae]|eukprot:KAF8819767.1 putative serine/threonine protein phosphatase [Cardiosporidium cionae]
MSFPHQSLQEVALFPARTLSFSESKEPSQEPPFNSFAAVKHSLDTFSNSAPLLLSKTEALPEMEGGEASSIDGPMTVLFESFSSPPRRPASARYSLDEFHDVLPGNTTEDDYPEYPLTIDPDNFFSDSVDVFASPENNCLTSIDMLDEEFSAVGISTREATSPASPREKLDTLKELSNESCFTSYKASLYDSSASSSKTLLTSTPSLIDAEDRNKETALNGQIILFDHRDTGQTRLLETQTIYDVDKWISKLLKYKPLTEKEIQHMCTLLVNILSTEQTCVRISSPLTVAGDIHGQLYDLIELFKIGGLPPHTSYLFLGDYVDRGYYSCETVCLVASLKIRFPSKVTLLRGNHESRQITQVYGFYDECIRKYGSSLVWKWLTDAFDYLPMVALIDQKIFCDHGGISPEIQTITQIDGFDRIQEVPPEGPMCDLLWSDPAVPEEENLENGWKPSPRGAGVIFGQGSIMTVDENLNKDFITFDSAPLRGSPEKTRYAPDYFL